MYFLYKVILGLLKRDPRFKPLENTSIRFSERVLQILPTLNRKFPSKLSRLLIYRYYYLKSKPPALITWYKRKNWRFRMWRSSTISYILYRGISSFKRFAVLNYLALGMFIGSLTSETDLFPGQELWTIGYVAYPKNDFMLSFIIDDFATKTSPDYDRKDQLTLGLDRLMLRGIENKELDPLSWMVLGSRYASLGDSEFSYLAFQMAHYKDHRNIGGNSEVPIEGIEAERFFSKQSS